MKQSGKHAAWILIGAIIGCSGESSTTASLDQDGPVLTGAFASPLAVQQGAGDRERMLQYLTNRVQPEDVVATVVIGKKPFDCVPIERQFSLRGTGARAGAVSRTPAALPPTPETRPASTEQRMPETSGEPDIGESCPAGSVPLQHFELGELERYGTLEAWLNRRGSAAADPTSPPATNHLYTARRDYVANVGFEAYLNVWAPVQEGGNGNFSLSQTWVVGCNLSGQTCLSNSRQTIEVGWIVCPTCEEGLNDEVGDDNGAELFVFTTPDNYNTSCWNGECNQWVQTSSTVALGQLLTKSAFEGTQKEARFLWYRDTAGDHNWWLRYGSEWVGYYKNNDAWFDAPGLEAQASYFTVGGELTDLYGGIHFAAMGSSRCPGWYTTANLYTRAAFVRNMQYLTTGNAWAAPAFDQLFEDAPYELGALNPHGANSNWLTHFYYGGPGDQVGSCP